MRSRRFVAGFLVVLLSSSAPVLAETRFVRGDTDGNGQGQLTDAIAILGFLFLGQPQQLPCRDAADADDNGKIDLTDAVYILTYQFLGGPPPRAPFPTCEVDPTADNLTCDRYSLCTQTIVPPAPPVVDPPQSPTRNREVEITGKAPPGLEVRLTNGQAVASAVAGPTGAFRRSISLRPNFVNRLYASVTGRDGTVSPLVLVAIVQDEQPPALYVDEPANGASTTAESIVVAGRVSDLLSGYLGLTVTVAGQPAQVIAGIGTNGSFERSGTPLATGANAIEVVAMDSLGNVARRTVSVTRTVVPDGSARLIQLSGEGQHARIYETLPQPIAVRALRGDGTPWARKLVTFEVTRSDGRLSTFPGAEKPTPMLQLRTDDQGIARAYWKLGGDAGCGNNRLLARGDGLADVLRFCASAAPGPTAQINVSTGDMTRAEAGGPAPEPFRAWVSDGCNGIGGVPVTFRVVKGGGLINGASQVTVTTTSTGHASVDFVLGPAQGNHSVEADFAENLGTPAVFTIYGVERHLGQPTSFVGLVLDNSNQPIGGATCALFVPGEEPIQTITASDGRFRFEGFPGSGHSVLRIEGSTATLVGGQGGRVVPHGSFPFLFFMLHVISNAENSITGPILLPPLDPANQKVYDGTQDLILEMAGVEGIRMKVKAGSMRLPDGTAPSPQSPAYLSLNQVHHDDVPMPMPDGAAPQLAWTLQPGGSTFDPPVEVTYPNLSGLPAGAIANFLSFNHDTHRFEIVSTGHVTSDGSEIVTDPGAGLTLAGWGCNCPPYSVRGKCKSCRVTGITASPMSASPWELVTVTATTNKPGKTVTFSGDLKGALTIQSGPNVLAVTFKSAGKKQVSGRCGTQSKGPSVTIEVVEIKDIESFPKSGRRYYCKDEEAEHQISLSSAVAGVPIDVDLATIDAPVTVLESKSVVSDGNGKASVKFKLTTPKGYAIHAKLKDQPKPTISGAFDVIDFEKGKVELKEESEADTVFSSDPQGFCERMLIDGQYVPNMMQSLTDLPVAWEIEEVGGSAPAIHQEGAKFKAQGPLKPGKWKVYFFCDANKNKSRDPGEPSVNAGLEVRPMMTFPLTVARHKSVVASDADVQLDLGVASDIMQRRNRPGDERCCVDLQLSGTVATFTDNIAPAVIDSIADWVFVTKVPTYVKIVDQLLFCGTGQEAVGCAELNSHNMVLDKAAMLLPSVWAHEWAHTRGLNHVPPSGNGDDLMSEVDLNTFSKNNVLSHLECVVLELP